MWPDAPGITRILGGVGPRRVHKTHRPTVRPTVPTDGRVHGPADPHGRLLLGPPSTATRDEEPQQGAMAAADAAAAARRGLVTEPAPQRFSRARAAGRAAGTRRTGRVNDGGGLRDLWQTVSPCASMHTTIAGGVVCIG